MNFWKNKDVLLTGADGFVGSHLAEKLIDLGAKLTIVVRATSNHGTSAYNFKNLPNNYVKKCKTLKYISYNTCQKKHKYNFDVSSYHLAQESMVEFDIPF